MPAPSNTDTTPSAMNSGKPVSPSKPTRIDNLFSGLPEGRLSDEAYRTLFDQDGVRIERIVSTGQASPPGFWYDQEHSECVLLLTGAARLRFEDEPGERPLQPGDFLVIPPHRRHRVEWTDPGKTTVWLAIHCMGH